MQLAALFQQVAYQIERCQRPALGEVGAGGQLAELIQVDLIDPDGLGLIARQPLFIQVAGQYHGDLLAHVAG